MCDEEAVEGGGVTPPATFQRQKTDKLGRMQRNPGETPIQEAKARSSLMHYSSIQASFQPPHSVLSFYLLHMFSFFFFGVSAKAQ